MCWTTKILKSAVVVARCSSRKEYFAGIYLGLYYDSNNGTWYSYDQQSQKYVPCGDQNGATSGKAENEPKASVSDGNRKAVICAPAATITTNEKTASIPDAVQAAATAALAAEKKEKEKMKDTRVASKSSILANKKKMSNVLSMWKQRNNEGQAARIVLNDTQSSASMDDRPINKFRSDSVPAKENTLTSLGFSSTAIGRGGHGASNMLTTPITAQTASAVSEIKPQPVSNSSGGTLIGVIRGSGRGVTKSASILSGGPSTSSPAVTSTLGTLAVNQETPAIQTPFRTDASVLDSYTSPVAPRTGKRRFSEQPTSSYRKQPQTTYRDRAAERRSLHGLGIGLLIQGLGNDGSGITEPVKAQVMEDRAGVWSKKRKVESTLEVQAGDSYRTFIQKKALA